MVEISAPQSRLEIDDITVDEYCVDIMSRSSLETSSFSQPACTSPVVSHRELCGIWCTVLCELCMFHCVVFWGADILYVRELL